MPVAEIIAIGTELLLGEIQDTNTHYLARNLRDAGVDLYRTMVVGDNAERIAQAIQEAMQRAQIIITTGGLGPTVDDPTREAVALAVGRETVFMPELWDQIQSRFQRYGRTATENNRRQAYIPAGALPVENPVGTAPAFIVETDQHAIVCLPGVPREMETLYQTRVVPYLRQRFQLNQVIMARVIHTAGMGESAIDQLIGDLEISRNPTAGLLAHAGQVDIRITAKAGSIEEAEQMIGEMAAVVRERLQSSIYGEEQDTLEGTVASALAAHGFRLGVIECGLDGYLAERIRSAGTVLAASQNHPAECSELTLQQEMSALQSHAEVIVAVSLLRGIEKQTLNILCQFPDQKAEVQRTYGGPPQMAASWAVSITLDFLRRALLEYHVSDKQG